jgi:hypothetical protein
LAERPALTEDRVRSSIIAAVLILAFAGAVRADAVGVAEPHGDIDIAVSVDSTAQSGRAQAAVRIHADRAAVWSVLTSCASAMRLVPGIVDCAVVETAPDRSWQLVRHVIDYSWYVPRLAFVFRADYRYPERISIRQVSGALRVLEGSWDLETDGDFTIARCSLALAPGFWVPRWLINAALKHDLPKMLRALRSAAESQGDGK